MWNTASSYSVQGQDERCERTKLVNEKWLVSVWVETASVCPVHSLQRHNINNIWLSTGSLVQPIFLYHTKMQEVKWTFKNFNVLVSFLQYNFYRMYNTKYWNGQFWYQYWLQIKILFVLWKFFLISFCLLCFFFKSLFYFCCSQKWLEDVCFPWWPLVVGTRRARPTSLL